MLSKLGKHKTDKICLYMNKLADVDLKVWRIDLVRAAYNDVKDTNGKTDVPDAC
jgi:hypothetical protein